MSSGEVRRVSRQDIQLVQNLIERCLQLYMNQKEVVHTLLVQAKIEPGFTELVWQKLEEENREFFKAYNIRLMLKHQITIFNELLEKQVELMDKIGPAGVVSLPIISNGSHTSALHQTPPRYIPEHTVPPKAENLHHQISPSPPTLLNGALPLHRVMYATDDISLLTGRMDISPNMLSAQNSQMGMMQGMNGNVIKPEPGYSNNSSFAFGATIGDASVASFSSIDSNSQHLHEPLMDNDISSYGFLGQIPRNFSLSDLTADFSQSSDILESYSRSPYLATDSDNFLDSQGRFECQGDKRLDTISEGLSYEEFGSD